MPTLGEKDSLLDVMDHFCCLLSQQIFQGPLDTTSRTWLATD